MLHFWNVRCKKEGVGGGQCRQALSSSSEVLWGQAGPRMLDGVWAGEEEGPPPPPGLQPLGGDARAWQAWGMGMGMGICGGSLHFILLQSE